MNATWVAKREGQWPGFAADTIELQIFQDEDPPNPREWDNLGTMVCWHRNYALGDKHDFQSPKDFLASIKSRVAVMLPLYLMDHSMLTIRTYPFDGIYGRWDSGQVGFIYITKEQIRKEMCYTSRKRKNPDLRRIKRISKELMARAQSILMSEVSVYNDYLQTNTWGFQLLRGGEDIHSCWGFYGTDWKANGLADQLGLKYAFLIQHLEEV